MVKSKRADSKPRTSRLKTIRATISDKPISQPSLKSSSPKPAVYIPNKPEESSVYTDSMLMEDYIETAKYCWSLNLNLFASDCFASHLTIKSPPYHERIYSDLQGIILAPERVGGVPPGSIEKGSHPSPTSLELSKYPMTSDIESSEKELSEESVLVEYLKNSVVIEPREFGKSTKAMIYVVWNLINRYKKFVLYISKSFDHAVKLVGPIKHEFEANEDIKEVYGDLRGTKWTESEMEFVTGAKLLAVGRGQTVRGLKFLNFRPDLVILDDIEDDESVSNGELRLKLHEWLDKQVIPGVDSKLGTVSAFGTILHPDSLLANISKVKDRAEKYRSFKTLFFGALDKDDKSIWEEKFSTEQLLAERKRDYYTFAQERMNQPIPIGSGMFKREYLMYFHVEDDLLITENKQVKLSECKLFMTTDVALTEKESSDYTVILITAISPDNDMYVLEYTRKRWADPEHIMNEIFRLHSKYPNMIEITGVEEVQAQKWLSVALRKEMKKRDKFFNLRALKADRDKLRRIAQLQPRFSNHSVFIKNSMGELEEELLLFPKSSHDDISDALSYQLQIISVPDRLESTNKRAKREDYKFSMTGEEVLNRIRNKSKAQGIFKEYQTEENYNPYRENDFEEVTIIKWDEAM